MSYGIELTVVYTEVHNELFIKIEKANAKITRKPATEFSGKYWKLKCLIFND